MNIIAQDIAEIIDLKNDGKKPTRVVSGIVIEGGNNPTIGLDPFNPLPKLAVIVPEYLKDYKVDVMLDGIGYTSMTVYNALKTGENVTMLQNDGQQSYLIITRTGEKQ